MKSGHVDIGTDELRALLLHRLPEAEALPLCERVLLDEEFAERLRDEEYALLGDYARGTLAVADRAAVEQHLLATSADRTRLKLAQALVGHRPHPRARLLRRHWIPAALAACVAIIVAGIWWSTLMHTNHQTPVATVTLLAEASRGAGGAQLKIPATGLVRLQAEVINPPTGAHYRLEISDASGRGLYSASGLTVERSGIFSFVEVRVPAVTLGPGERHIEVSGPGYAFTWIEQAHH